MRWRVRRPGADLGLCGMALVHDGWPHRTPARRSHSGGATGAAALRLAGLVGLARIDAGGERFHAAGQRIHVLRGRQADPVDHAADALLERLLERGDPLVGGAGEILDHILGPVAAARGELLALLEGGADDLAGLVAGGLDGALVRVPDRAGGPAGGLAEIRVG